jgi:tyrosyl-tRNA synthetase
MQDVAIPPPAEQLPILERGIVDLNVREDLLKRLERSHAERAPLIIKAGFDPTASDIHLGHTVLMEKMRQFQQLGHRVVFIVGDYTALIGDPTGRNTLRPPLTPEQIAVNAQTYREQAVKILDPQRTEFRFNSEWLSRMSFRDIIELASKYNLGRMLERRDFKARFESGKQIALHEFLYPLMQGHDSVVLQADVELGGSDQIFNLNVGRHLMAANSMAPQVCMTVPLLVGLDGVEKMSKSKGNHIGITEPPEAMFGKVMSISDETMAGWYPLLLGREADMARPLEEKKELARQLVARFHGEGAADETLSWWNAGRPAQDVPEFDVEPGALLGIMVSVGMAKSNSDARRKIQQGGVSLDDAVVSSQVLELSAGSYLLRVGKKSLARLQVKVRAQ